MAPNRILLETGTNEVEILEFVLRGQPFGVNVLKIQAIEQFDPSRVTQIQFSPPSVIGTLLFRDTCITLIDLAREMDTLDLQADEEILQAVEEIVDDDLVEQTPAPVSEAESAGADLGEVDSQPKLVLVMEFNDLKTAFLVDGVNRIHRASWDSISPMSSFLNSGESNFTGSLQINGREILLVDMEKVVTELLPSPNPENMGPEGAATLWPKPGPD